MTGISLAHRIVRRAALTIVLVTLALGAVLLPAASHRAGAYRRPAAATPTPALYHLSVIFTQGATAGNRTEGQVNGVMDSTGVLTATLTATDGTTSTVTGSLSAGGAALTLQGGAGNLTLSGQGAGPGSYGGSVSQAGMASVGSWLLTPEASPLTLVFRAGVTSGPNHGHTYMGTLTIATGQAGRVDGTLVLEDGTAVGAEGRLANGNFQITVDLPGAGLLMGVGLQGSINSTGTTYVTYKGSFVGPSVGDRGAWAAVQAAS